MVGYERGEHEEGSGPIGLSGSWALARYSGEAVGAWATDGCVRQWPWLHD
ncbi:hypothetical protein BH24ACT15_BH24ACT15_38720 [soil metagenome]